MRKLSMLILDDSEVVEKAPRAITDENPSVEFELIFEDDLPGAVDTYKLISSEFGDWLETNASRFNIIVIGNNKGAGIQKAARIPQAIRPRTLIVWTDLPKDRESYQPYKDLGCTNFCTRRGFEDWLVKKI